MFIQTEETPNPSTIKFIPGEIVLKDRTQQFNNKKDAKKSPLAESLFEIDTVKAVFFGSDFVSITIKDDTTWETVKADVLTRIMDHFVAKKPIMADEENDETNDETLDPIAKQIKELIETRVRPAVAQDGGDIIFKGFKDGVVSLELHGACSGCPSSTITLKDGIENLLKHYVPEVESVEAVE